MKTRIFPDRVLTGAEKQVRYRVREAERRADQTDRLKRIEDCVCHIYELLGDVSVLVKAKVLK